MNKEADSSEENAGGAVETSKSSLLHVMSKYPLFTII